MDRVRRMTGCDHKDVKPYTGKGVYAAVLDSGVAAHPDLRGRIAVFKDFVSNKSTAYDDNGHGTHVSGILAGNGAVSKGKYRGIAPECMLVCGKVLDKEGGGSLKNLTKGLIWISELIRTVPIRVLNISIEMESEDGIDPLLRRSSYSGPTNTGYICEIVPSPAGQCHLLIPSRLIY